MCNQHFIDMYQKEGREEEKERRKVGINPVSIERYTWGIEVGWCGTVGTKIAELETTVE